MAKMHFKYGAMNSGKSADLLRTAHNYLEQGLEIATLKPEEDTKDEENITSRAMQPRRPDIITNPEMDLHEAVQGLGKAALQCVLVDEAQFLKKEQVSQLYEIAKKDDISVIGYGLLTDFQTNVFEGSRRFIEISDNHEEIPTMCRCGSQAKFNARKVDDEFVFEGSQIAIDGKSNITYDSMCGGCYMQEGGVI